MKEIIGGFLIFIASILYFINAMLWDFLEGLNFKEAIIAFLIFALVIAMYELGFHLIV